MSFKIEYRKIDWHLLSFHFNGFNLVVILKNFYELNFNKKSFDS